MYHIKPHVYLAIGHIFFSQMSKARAEASNGLVKKKNMGPKLNGTFKASHPQHQYLLNNKRY